MANLDEVQNTAKMLLTAIDITPIFACLCNHPFTDSFYVPIQDSRSADTSFENIYEDESAYQRWKKAWFKRIDAQTSAMAIMMYIRSPWRLTFLKFAIPYLDKEEIPKLLAAAWVMSENPNTDANFKTADLLKCFKGCDKRFLMDEEEYAYYESLPEEVIAYRGVGEKSNPKGLSWTLSKRKAKWFAERYGNEGATGGYILKAAVPKKYILAYFDSRGEEELIVDISAIQSQIEKLEE